MICRVEGHIHDTFKREHPIRHGTSVEIRVCFRCFNVEAGPVGQLHHESDVPLEAFRGDAGWVIIKKGGRKAPVLNQQQSGYRGNGYARVITLCGSTQVSALDLSNAKLVTAEEEEPIYEDELAYVSSLRVNLAGALDDVSCKNCLKALAVEWRRALAGCLELTGCRSLVRRIMHEPLATIPKCECLHPAHAGNCPAGTCGCMIRTIHCAGCNFSGREPEGGWSVWANSKDAPPAPWAKLPDTGGLFCPTCVEATNF